MRSRYSAYALGLVDYLMATQATRFLDENSADDIAAFANAAAFIHLQVHYSEQQGDAGVVEFTASYLLNDMLCKLRERSQFEFTDRWRYTEGQISPIADQKLNRNDPCPCLSGKKFKQCHGR